MLALKRLSDAERDGDRDLCGHSRPRLLLRRAGKSVYAPRSEGQAKALRRAYERAGYGLDTSELVEAHGTATKAGDVAEFAALKSVFEPGMSTQRCAIGSVKSQIGHTKAAAGAAGLIKAVLALQHSTLPPAHQGRAPESRAGAGRRRPFYINAQTRPWVRTGDRPRRASVSSFGFGGSNFHVTLEEYRGEQRAKRLRILRHRTRGAERQQRSRSRQAGRARSSPPCVPERALLESHSNLRASSMRRRPRAQVWSRRIPNRSRHWLTRLRKALAEGAGAQLKDPNIAVGFGQAREGKTAFLFPGQGSQYVGMGADLALDFPEALAVWDGLDGDLADLHGVVFPEPGFDASSLDAQKAELTAMANAQPAIATTSLAQLALLDVLGVTADAAAGHSFGEVTALAAAGVIPMERLVETARTRGVLMAEAGRGKDGAMLAIAASAEDVRALLDSQPQSAGSLVMANDNAPQQVVLAGHASDIAWAEAAAKSAGWTSRRLPVASAFHSSIVAASSEPLATYLKTLKLGQAGFPVYANATAQPYGEQVADQLADQVRQPVKFREMIEAMARDGVTRFIEVGPGRVLTGLVGQILDTTPHIAVALDDPKAGGLRGWHRGLAALAADGVALDLVSLFDHYDAPAKHVAAPAHAVLVGGANLGKPYPPADGKTSITLKRARMTLPDAPSPVAEGPQLTPAVQRVDAPLSTDAWSVIDRIQKETAEQHQHYLDVMTQSHQAFLDVSAQMMAQIVGDHATVAQAPMSTPNAVLDVTVSSLQQAPEAVATPAPRPLPQQVLAPVSDHRPSESAGDVVLAIVSEKTGYPADMLGLGMEMEAELGIDSIKQVEILAALQARFPGAPPIPASELAGLRTLQDVVDSIAGFTAGDRTEHLVGVQHSAPSSSSSAVLCCTEAAFRPVPPTGFAMAGLRDGEVFITREDPVFADALERVMTTHGIKARAVDDVPDEAGAVICLAALAAARSPEECVQMHVRAFHSARSVAKSSAESRLFVTVQSTGAGFAGADVPVGVASLVKTAAWEWPNASVRAIDIESLDAERLTVELVEGGSGVEVALRDDGARLVVVDDVEASPAGETISVAQGGVVVVTGGARGVTAESALALAARHGLRLALLGRTTLREASPEEPSGTTVAEIATALVASAHARGETIGLPQARAHAERLIAQREVRATLSAAQQQGTAARYFTTDITDRAELRKVLDEVRQTFGPIVGVVHGAGVLADKRLEDLDDDQFVRVFSTKLVGAEALLDATSSDDLRFISLFSSIAARAGNAGQSAYAAANATLETIAAREAARRGSACVVRAFGWGPWDGGMVDATLRSRFLDAGVGLIPIDEGAEFFAEQALCRSSAPAVVVAAPAEGRLRATRLEWDVSTENLPVLEDHQVRGRVVVPVVIVLDAMLRAARGLVAEACPVVRDFQVLSGVTFAASEKQALTLAFDPTGSSYTVTIRDCEGRPRYRAILETEPDASPNVSVPEMSGSPWPMSIDDAYADYLFHGPRFAAIENLDNFGSDGGTGSLKGLHDLGWPESDWAIDPAIVDGGLQLGLLWASALGRSLMLPQRIGRVVLNRPFPENAVVRCRFAARPINDKRVDYDVAFETTDGARVAALEGVEFYAAGPTADASA